MLSKKELEQERKREANYNKLSEQVISKTAWGKFYGLMRLASATGEGAIKHKICIDKNGRILKIYKSKAGKWVGSFLKPAHEQASRDLSQKKYGRAFLDMVGFGSFLDVRDQMKAKCFTMRPNDLVKPQDRNDVGLNDLKKKVRKDGLAGLGCVCRMGYVKSKPDYQGHCKCGNQNVWAKECCNR